MSCAVLKSQVVAACRFGRLPESLYCSYPCRFSLQLRIGLLIASETIRATISFGRSLKIALGSDVLVIDNIRSQGVVYKIDSGAERVRATILSATETGSSSSRVDLKDCMLSMLLSIVRRVQRGSSF